MSSDEHAAIRAWSQRIVRSNLELACACGFPGFFFFLPKISESFYQAFQGFGGSFKQRFCFAIVDFANVQSCMMRSVIQHLFQFLCGDADLARCIAYGPAFRPPSKSTFGNAPIKLSPCR